MKPELYACDHCGTEYPPDELLEVIIFYYFQELKLREIAGILHISLPLVKYRLRQAKIQLEKLLGKEDEHESGRKT